MPFVITKIIAVLLCCVASAASAADRHVLVLHSYHAGLAWADAVQRGIDEAFRDSKLELAVHVEYLDALRYRSQLPALKANLDQALQTKFGQRPPDVVVVSDNDAFDHLLAVRQELLPGVPLVFAGINGLHGYAPESLARTTGVAEEASFSDTLDVMERLFPGRKVLVVGDKSTTFLGNLKGFRRASQQRPVPTNIEVFDDPVLSHIETRLRSLDQNQLVFLMSRPVNENGETVPIPQAVRQLSAASPVPIFSGWDFMLGHGIVGGRLVSGEAQGLIAGRQAVAILGGLPVESVPIVWESPNRHFYDYAVLSRFGVESAALPAGATLINRPVSFYEANRDKVLITALVMLGLLVVIAVLIMEIVRRRRAELRLSHVATHDALTGLINRGLLGDFFLQGKALADRNNKAIACLMLDLDHFKEINDSLGHGMGDRLLKEVALRLGAGLRNSDTVCRIGGDEFAVLLNQIDQPQEAASCAEKIGTLMQTPLVVNGQPLTISFSIGISVYPGDSSDFDSLLKNADLAMYQAKHSGRNGYRFFDPSMNAAIQRRQRLHQHLSGAHLRGEMALHVQPQRSLSDGRIVGAEALLRWHSPDLGEVSPGEFIPLAESSGLIVALGAWVFEQGCGIVAAWQEAGYPAIPLGINVSVAQLRRTDFADFVGTTLERYRIAPTRIEIEITESVFMDDVAVIATNLRALEKMGVLLAIDDFGTGYSNLAYLKETAADRLKIDRAFVKDILDNPNDVAIVRAIIQIGQSLGMKTIAEGVEHQEQADFLASLGCDSMQGFLFSRAVPVAEFSIFFEAFGAGHQLKAVDLRPPIGLAPAASAQGRSA